MAKTSPVQNIFSRSEYLLTEMQGPKENPHIAALADSEVREHDAQRQIETLRELLGLIRDVWTDLPDEIAAKIDAVLRG
jgi:hypothetical protein